MKLLHPVNMKNFAHVFQVVGYMGFLTVVVALTFGEYLSIVAFGGIAMVTLLLAWMISRKVKHQRTENNELKKPVLFAALSYAIISFILAVPLFVTAVLYDLEGQTTLNLQYLNSPLNSLFESFAGLTSSGLTMIKNPEDIPHVIQFWRSLSQWVGGLGVVILAKFLISPGEKGLEQLADTELGNINTKDPYKAIRDIWKIYTGFTAVAFVLYLIAGQSVWISLNHALTSVSTGGFNVTNESFAYQPLDSKIFSLIILILGALSFKMHLSIIRNKSLSGLFTFRESFWFFVILISGVLLMMMESWISPASPSLMDNVYQWVSALTTSGYQTADISNWHSGKLFLLSLAMIVGGVEGSTAGGFKIRRVLLLLNIMWFSLSGEKSRKYKKAIEHFGEGKKLEEIALNFVTMAGCWIILLLFSVLVVAFVAGDQYSLAAVFFEVCSAQGNVGLSTGLTGADMHWLIKVDFILLMWMGRLELVAVILLFGALFKRRG